MPCHDLTRDTGPRIDPHGHRGIGGYFPTRPPDTDSLIVRGNNFTYFASPEHCPIMADQKGHSCGGKICLNQQNSILRRQVGIADNSEPAHDVSLLHRKICTVPS